MKSVGRVVGFPWSELTPNSKALPAASLTKVSVMEWLFSIEPVRSFKLWLWMEKFSVIQLGPLEPVSKPVAQEY